VKNGLNKFKFNESDLILKATNALITSFNLQVNVHLSSTDKPSTIEISPPNQDKKYIFEPYVKKEANHTVTLGLAKMHSDNSNEKVIFISEFIHPQIADSFRELGIPFIDTVGNAYINEVGLYILGNSQKKPAKKTTERVFSPAGMEVLFALLSVPNLESENYRQIRDFSDVSLGTIALVMKSLENQGYLITRRKKRLLIRKAELINLWVQNYSQILRPKYQSDHKFSQANSSWWKEINLSAYKCFWSGEVAGHILTKYLEPQKFVIYQNMSESSVNLIADNNWKFNKAGEIELLYKFWNFPTENDVAPPLLVYADLTATAEPRNLETAKMIYDEYLTKLIGENS
jgi:hypothetical protein